MTRPRNKWLLPVAAILLLGALGAAWKWIPRGRAVPAGQDLSHRIAVLPFENLGDSSRLYFANGVTEAITTQLTGINGLTVIPRASAARYRGTTKPLGQVASELGVGYVLTGTVQWDETPGREPRVRVSPELIRVSDTSSVWAHGYDAVLTSVFDVYSDVSTQVAGALAVAIDAQERNAIARRPTQNAEAYDLYLRAVDIANRGLAAENSTASIAMLQRAVALDPNFAIAWGRLAEQLSLAHWLYIRHDDSTMAQATAAAETALRLQPDLPEAHRAMGNIWYRKRDYDKALAEFAIVRRSQPNSTDLYQAIGFVERRQGKWEESIRDLSRGRDLDPGSAQSLSQLGETYSILHRYDSATAQFRRAIELAPDQPDAYYFLMMSQLSRAGDTAEARAILREGAAHMPAANLLVGKTRPFAFVVAADSALTRAFESTFATVGSSDETARYLFRADLRRFRGDSIGARVLYDSVRTILRQRLAQMPDDYGFQARLGQVEAILGNADAAIRAGKRAVELLPPERDSYFGVDNVAALAGDYALLGRAGPAVEQLRIAFQHPTVLSRQYLRVDPTFDRIRNDPEFKAWMAESP